MIPLRAFIFNTYGDRIVIDFLNTDSNEVKIAERVRHILESNVGRVCAPHTIINQLIRNTGDEKKALLYFYASKFFYDFEVKEAPNTVLEFYLYIEKNHHGFIPLGRLNRVISNYCTEKDIEERNFRLLLAESIFGAKRLIRKRDLKNPKYLILIANYLLLEKAFSLLYEAKIKFCNVKKIGYVIKNFLFKAKKERILVDILEDKGCWICEIRGPKQLYSLRGASSRGKRICELIIDTIYRVKNWEVRGLLSIGHKNYIIKVDSQSAWAPEFVTPWNIGIEELCVRDFFDSDVERTAYTYIIEALPSNCVVMRESDIIKIGKRIFIPDFTIMCGNRKIYVEVIGFWSKEYIRRKRGKLEELEKIGEKNLLLIIDSRLKKWFASLKFPKIWYHNVQDLKKNIKTTLIGLV